MPPLTKTIVTHVISFSVTTVVGKAIANLVPATSNIVKIIRGIGAFAIGFAVDQAVTPKTVNMIDKQIKASKETASKS